MDGIESLAILLFVAGAQSPAARGEPKAPIATDRPSVAASSSVVPHRAIQIESGATDTVRQRQHTVDGPETLVRMGVTSQTELRLTVPNLVEQTGTSQVGVADVTVGLKQQLSRGLNGFDVSLIASVSLPTGTDAVSSHGYDPSLQLPWSHPVTSSWTAAGMVSLYAPTEGKRRNVTGEVAIVMDRQLASRCDGFAEYVGDFPQEGGARHLAHFGAAFKVTSEQQLDVHVGVGLSSAAPDFLIGVGYSFRLPGAGRWR